MVFYFEIITKLFFSPHFSFYLCDKLNVIISKVHHESTIFLESSIFLNMIPTKIFCKIDN
jgi:hypothetical protein